MLNKFHEYRYIINILLIGAITIIGALVLAVVLSKVGYWLKFLYQIPTDPNVATLLGSITGGIIGGVGAIIAILLSIHQTDKIQKLHQRETIINESKKEAENLAEIIANYAAHISAYYYYYSKMESSESAPDTNKDIADIKRRIESHKVQANKYLNLLLIRASSSEYEEITELARKIHRYYADAEISYDTFYKQSDSLIKLAEKFFKEKYNIHIQ